MSCVKSTVVGAWVKGAVKNWFTEQEDGKRMMAQSWRPHLWEQPDEEILSAMVSEVIEKQAELGVDIVTDGEVGREGYYMHFVRNGLTGIDLVDLSDKVMRDGAFVSQVPSVVSRVEAPPSPWCYKEFLRAKSFCPPGTEVKYTLPGPMTMMDGTFNRFYQDERELIKDIIRILQREVLCLAAHGCEHIQVDEPTFMRYPDKALQHGVADLKEIFLGCPPNVKKTVHLCCGYPDRLEPTTYKKSDKRNYRDILLALDEAGIDWASIEDAEAVNDLEHILKDLKNLGIIFGAVTIARKKVESVEIIKKRAMEALKYLPSNRLMLAPDCGLGFLPLDLAETKLKNMTEATKEINLSLSSKENGV